MAKDGAYRAVSDPTRRDILDLLRDRGPQRAGDIAGRFGAISRPAVSKHLRILRRAGLVVEATAGRERWYQLNPEPLRQMYEGWLRRYEAFWGERLRSLKEIIEADYRRETGSGRDRLEARDTGRRRNKRGEST